ncbi:MAG: gamma-glutamyltransferase [Bacteroidota bacterium]
MSRILPISLLALLVISLSTCRQAPQLMPAEKTDIFSSAALTTPHPVSSQVGLDILKQGGNAIDAAVAVQFAMAVVYPRAGNLGGGGFLVYRPTTGPVRALDYREKAPAAADRDMYLDENEEVIPGLSTRGHLAAGVPGTVAGIVSMHAEHGSLSWEELVQPAIDLARNGFALTQSEVNRFHRYQEDFRAFNEESPFLADSFQLGQTFYQQDLAKTLERIRDQGKAGFYQGETADLIVAEMKSSGGLITHEDLSNYETAWRTPVSTTYRDYTVYSMPPASSGGVALSQMLGMLEPYPLAEYGFQSLESGHLTIEAMRRAYADRAEYLGDSDFYPVPIADLIDSTYLANRMADFSLDSASTSNRTEAGILALESFETTHISIVDEAGNAVSITTTLNGNFGGKVIVDGGGFFLNNEMDDFSSKPGVPNMFGLVGAEANAIAPGKRMLSSMTPTIVERDGELFLVLGAPGGSTIITAVLQVFTNVADYGMPIDSAIRAARFHHQWLPDSVLVEPSAFSPRVRAELEALGHGFKSVNSMAVIKAVQVLEDGRLQAAGDPRNPDDDVAGY